MEQKLGHKRQQKILININITVWSPWKPRPSLNALMQQAPPTYVFYWINSLSVSKFAFFICSPSSSVTLFRFHTRQTFEAAIYFTQTNTSKLQFMAIENFIFKQVFVLLFIIQLSRLKGKKKKSLSPSPRLQAVN